MNRRSSDSRVAAVSEGTVKAVGEGTAVVTATSINGLSDSVEITVTGVGLSLNRSTLSLKKGESFQLKAKPSLAEAKKLKGEWLSEDAEVAAVGAGAAKIGVRARSGVYDVCSVRVK